MIIPEGFQFSQSNLQDYVDCKRRFQLRYLMRVAWPASQAGPIGEHERYLRLGSEFHFLIRQHQAGLPAQRLSATIPFLQGVTGDELSEWWDSYLASPYQPENMTSMQPGSTLEDIDYFTEYRLSIPIQGFRLIAKLDMLILLPSGQTIIIDWKTSRQRSKRNWLQMRLQTRIYPLVLSIAGQKWQNNFHIAPENIRMCYWFTNYPGNPECFQYSSDQFANDEAYINGLIKQVIAQGDEEFSRTHNEMHCQYCVYRSLCDRGIVAGSIENSESENNLVDIDIDFDDIKEIEYE